MDKKNMLLSKREKSICEKLGTKKNLDGKRAKALLTLNEGDSQVAAAKKSGLSYGQVKYLITVFRKSGLAIFTETNLKQEESVIAKKEKSKDKDKEKKAKKKDKKKTGKKAKEKAKSKKKKDKKKKSKKSKKK